MDILALNEKMICPASTAKIVGHVIDTGVNPVGALAGRVEIVKYADKPGDTGRTLGGGQAYDYSDRYGDTGHGTGVAYLMCLGIPNMRIRSYNNMIGLDWSVNLCLAAVLEYVKAHPEERHIVNMSLQTGGKIGDPGIIQMHSLIQQLVALNAAVVVAAGNDGRELLDAWPSCFQEPITVAALYNDGSKASFSVWHNEVDFAEIGVRIPLLAAGGEMTYGSGTSFATPIVANKLAKIWCARPDLTEQQLYEVAVANAMDFGGTGRDPYYGYGWIASVEVAATPPAPVEPEPEIPEAPNGDTTRLLYLTTPRMSGADVYSLELQLEALGYDCKMSSDERSSKIGVFGPACDTAVRQFQRDYTVDVYGKAGPFTRAALIAAQPVQSPAGRFLLWLNHQVGQGYAWGAQGDNLTAMIDHKGRKITGTPEEWIRKKETSPANAERVIAFYRKLVAAGKSPILMYDCSGLIVRWLMDNGLIPGDLSSRGLYSICTKIKRSELQPGNLLFRRDEDGSVYHVGVYAGSGEAIEAQGRDAGVVRRGIDAGGKNYWTDFGSLNCLKQ